LPTTNNDNEQHGTTNNNNLGVLVTGYSWLLLLELMQSGGGIVGTGNQPGSQQAVDGDNFKYQSTHNALNVRPIPYPYTYTYMLYAICRADFPKQGCTQGEGSD
jgi:hypothetical protein